MQRTPFQLDYQVQTLAPLRLPALPSGGAVEQPQLSGSVIKGAARRSAVGIAALLAMPPCRTDADPRCALCRLFGAPGLDAALHWSPAKIVHSGPAAPDGPDRQVRYRRPVDRTSGVGTGELAPARVALAAGLLFGGRLQGWLAGDGVADAAFIVTVLNRLEYVGGGQASGYGRVGCTVGAIRLAGEPRNGDELLATLRVQEAV